MFFIRGTIYSISFDPFFRDFVPTMNGLLLSRTSIFYRMPNLSQYLDDMKVQYHRWDDHKLYPFSTPFIIDHR